MVDYISMHQYYDNYDNDTAEFLANSTAMDRFISRWFPSVTPSRRSSAAARKSTCPLTNGTYGSTPKQLTAMRWQTVHADSPPSSGRYL